MIEALEKLTNLLVDGQLKPGAPRFDQSQLSDIHLGDDEVTFYFISRFISVPLKELTIEEAHIVRKYYLDHLEEKEDETKNALDPRPWKQPVSYQRAAFYSRMIYWVGIPSLIMLLFIAYMMFNPLFYHPTAADIDNKEALSIALNDPHIKEVLVNNTTYTTSIYAIDDASPYGYPNVTGNVKEVAINVFQMSQTGVSTYDVFIDMANKTVLGIK